MIPNGLTSVRFTHHDCFYAVHWIVSDGFPLVKDEASMSRMDVALQNLALL